MKTLIKYLVIMPILAMAFAVVPQTEQANAQCLQVSRGRVSIRKVSGSRFRMFGSNFYFNLSCSGRIATGNATLSSGRYCVGTRLRNSRGGTCRITSIFLARSAGRVGLPLRSSPSALCSETWNQ